MVNWKTGKKKRPVAEANVACDPVAADYVFQSGMKITAVGLDVTMKVRFKRAYLDWIQTHCRPELKRAAEYLGKAFEWYFMGKNINPALPVKAVKMPVRIMSFPMGPVITAGKIAGRLLHMYRKCPCGRWNI